MERIWILTRSERSGFHQALRAFALVEDARKAMQLSVVYDSRYYEKVGISFKKYESDDHICLELRHGDYVEWNIQKLEVE